MSELFTTSTPYLLLAFFVFMLSMQRHMMNFKGSSKVFYSLLTIVVALCFIGVLVLLVCLGIVIESWWIPIVLLIGGILASGFIQGIISIIIPEYILSVCGVILCPILLVVMYANIYSPNFMRDHDQYVYICTGDYSESYHRTGSCDGLNACQSQIVEITFEQAKSFHRRQCRICKPRTQ